MFRDYLSRFLLSKVAFWLFVGLINLVGAPTTQAQLISLEDIKKISPKADDALAKAIANAEDLFVKHGVTTRLRMAHFITQIMTETGGLKRLDENMNYSENTLLRVFSRKTISRAKAEEIARKPREIANWVYGARLGNRGRDTDDGWQYRGSGYIQLTGLFNFRKRGAEIGIPIADNPELARQPETGLKAAFAYWTARKINAAADDHDRRRVRVLVNGPSAHGFAQSKVWFNKVWTTAFSNKEVDGSEGATLELAETAVADDKSLFDEILKDSGILRENFSSIEAGAQSEREQALREFQNERGIPETGVLDEATQDALLDPVEWRHQEDGVTIVPTETRNPDEGVMFDLRTSAGIESFALTSTEPKLGTGNTLADVQLTIEEQSSFSVARGIYAGYEMGAAVAYPETFVPFSVIDEDDRVAVIDTTGFPERAVVQILFNTGAGESLCTGTMISKDTVLTAGHCVHSGTLVGGVYSDFRLIPGRNKGAAPFGRCGAKNVFALSGWVNAQTSLEARYYDLGAIKLDCDIGLTTGWMGVRVLGDDKLDFETVVHGYAADKAPPGRQWISKDELRVLWELKGFYKNDTYGGTSGARVSLIEDNDYIVGVHTNGLHGDEPWASHNAFTRITPSRLKEIIRWVEQK